MLGTYQLLELARKKKSQNFLFISSGEVYGVVHHEIQAIGENDYGLVDPTKVRSCYAEGKRVGENLCVNWSHQFEVPTKIVRPFHTYGPGLKLDDGRVYADFIADIVAQRDIVLKSSGAAVRSFCYVADAIRGFFTVMLKGKNAEAYNVGNLSEAHSVAELAEALVALYPERNIKVRREARETSYLESPIPRNCPNVEKARALGWKPRYTIEEGFRKTIETYL
jgi:nucleoside-diphosphate-sugar epimerase